MSDILVSLLSATIGAGVVYYFLISKYTTNKNTDTILLLENIKKVCKLITIETELVEIITHTDTKSVLFNLFNFEKKAVMVVKAKAVVGFDLSKAKIDINEKEKVIRVHQFPKPEIVSIEPDINFYDIQQSMFNKFSTTDYNELSNQIKEVFKVKIMQSNVPDKAIEQAQATLDTIGKLTILMDWKVEHFLAECKSNIPNRLD